MQRPALSMMTLALTGQCNLRCGYCYQNAKSGAAMPWPVLRSAADRLLESPAARPELVFAGGEPLLALDAIRRAVDYLEQHGRPERRVRFNLATNGTLLTPGVIAFLRTHAFAIQLSFDGVLPAQSVRGEHSFARIEDALDRLRVDAPEIFWRRLTVGVTLDADAVPYLSESISYFLDRRLPTIVILPAGGQSLRWTPSVLSALSRQLTMVSEISRRYYDETGSVPVAALRKTSNDPPAETDAVCGGAASGNVTVDVDGETYACPFLAESSQRFANQRLAEIVRPMRTGNIASARFWTRLAEMPLRARETGVFHVGTRRRSLHGYCIKCTYRLECTACPLTVLVEPGHDDAQRIPDYICAFNWTLMSLRRKFPVQPDAAALLEGRAPKPRLVRELLERAGAGRQGLRPGLLTVAEGRPPSGSQAPS